MRNQAYPIIIVLQLRTNSLQFFEKNCIDFVVMNRLSFMSTGLLEVLIFSYLISLDPVLKCHCPRKPLSQSLNKSLFLLVQGPRSLFCMGGVKDARAKREQNERRRRELHLGGSGDMLPREILKLSPSEIAGNAYILSILAKLWLNT